MHPRKSSYQDLKKNRVLNEGEYSLWKWEVNPLRTECTETIDLYNYVCKYNQRSQASVKERRNITIWQIWYCFE